MELGVQTHYSQGYWSSLMDKAIALGATSIRDAQPWGAIEKTAGVYEFKPGLTNYMAQAAAGGLGTTLTFSGGNALYDSGKTPYTAEGRQAYADHIVAVLQKYGSTVQEIEIWNEFNTNNFTGPAAADRNGTYVALLKTVYETVKPLFPDVTILGGSSNVIATGVIEDLLKLGAGDYMDGVAIHPYKSTAENLDQQLQHLKDVMAEYGAVKPIYATEFGNTFKDAADVPDFMVKAVVQMSAVGVAEADWYALLENDGTNMGLINRDGSERPGAAAFSFIQKTLLPLGDAVRVDFGDDRTMVYKFGTDTYVMWGSDRAATFAAGSTFYNSKGEVIATPTGLSETPIIVKTTGYTLGETKVVADSLLEYGDSNVWTYYAKSGNTLTSLEMVDWDWTSYYGSRYTKPLRINDSSLAPGGDGKNPIQAVERYTSDKDQTLKLVGTWNVGTDGDGVDLHILVNGQEIFSKVFNGSFDLSDLSVTLSKGDTLDFAVGPNQSSTGDSTNYRIQLIAMDGPVANTIAMASRTLYGTGAADTLVGGNGNDLMYGSSGNDSYDGGKGSDTVSFEKIGQAVSVDLAVSGVQTLANRMTAQFTGIENIIGTRFGDMLAGDDQDNRITAGDGNDTIRASAGNDILDGGDGVDILMLNRLKQGVTLSLSETGAQDVGTGSITLVSIENLSGTSYDDVISGDGGNNVLNGLGGTDTISYANAAGGVTVSLAIGAAQVTGGAGTDTLTNFENLTGSNFADVLTGSGSDNTILAGGGNDLIYATAGRDTIDGGAGIDTLSFEKVGVGLTLDLGRTDYQRLASVMTQQIVEIENVTGSNYDDTLTGNAGDNVIRGGGGNDTLAGGGGTDTLDGGTGSDTASFATASAGVTVSLAATGAQTTGAGTVTLVSIENLLGSAYNDVLTGDAGANTLRGGAGDDLLIGAGGNDTLDGGAGFDTASYADARSAVTVTLATTAQQDTGGAGLEKLIGIEALIGSRFNDTLTGGNGNDSLDGGAGNDVLIGGNGQDLLRGGLGADSFVFRSVSESTVAAPDRILDFSSAQGDKIDLSQIDANSKTVANDAFSLVSAFTKQAGQLVYAANDGGVLVQGDVNGDGKADFAIQVLGVTKLTASDFAF